VRGFGRWCSGFALASFLYDVSPFDPVTFLAVVGIISAAALAAAWLPARRAVCLDPARALRHD
jgi:putative ABC transport system permease protein